MPLSAGTRLGPYEVPASTGAGGMGEVYGAQDFKLKREVALKLLPGAWPASYLTAPLNLFAGFELRIEKGRQHIGRQIARTYIHPGILVDLTAK